MCYATLKEVHKWQFHGNIYTMYMYMYLYYLCINCMHGIFMYMYIPQPVKILHVASRTHVCSVLHVTISEHILCALCMYISHMIDIGMGV